MARSVSGLLLLAVFVLCAFAAPAMAEKRVALVIGNSAYRTLRTLKNPANDGTDVAAALKSHGFEVLRGIDLDRAGMARIMDRFVAAADHADVALFYYAGHGIQIAAQNYLVPVDATLSAIDQIPAQTVALTPFLNQLSSSPAVKLIFLDACRNNPDPDKSQTLPNGLARVGSAAGFLIAFATQPDNVAYDGGGRNSPFAQAFLGHLGTQGQDLSDMMIAVRKDVVAATGGYQVPWENSSLLRQFYFEPASSVTLTAENQLWHLAGSTRDPALLRIYVDRYADGPHVADARSLLASGQTVALSGGDTSRAAAATPGDDAQQVLWEVARNARVRALVDYYLRRYPTGRFAAEARALVATLGSTDDISAAAAPDVTCERLATHPRDATANNAGVALDVLARHADAAIAACRAAAAQHPETPHYTALLARAMAASGRGKEALALYRQAADRGDLRAMVSLGLLLESGDGVARDVKAALSWYERAAKAGSADGAINFAVALQTGEGGIPRDVKRAVALLRRAAADGSALATFDLGVLAQEHVEGTPAEALHAFRKATELGEPRGYRAAAVLLDEGRGVPKAPERAARLLLEGVALDGGDLLAELSSRAGDWSKPTLMALQSELKRRGYLKGAVDGRPGPRLTAALQQWRRRGDLGPLTAEAGEAPPPPVVRHPHSLSLKN